MYTSSEKNTWFRKKIHSCNLRVLWKSLSLLAQNSYFTSLFSAKLSLTTITLVALIRKEWLGQILPQGSWVYFQELICYQICIFCWLFSGTIYYAHKWKTGGISNYLTSPQSFHCMTVLNWTMRKVIMIYKEDR